MIELDSMTIAAIERAYGSVMSKQQIFSSFAPRYENVEEKEYELLDVRREFNHMLTKLLYAHNIDIKERSIKTHVIHINPLERDINTTFKLSDGVTAEIVVTEDWLGQCKHMLMSFSGHGKGYAKYYDNITYACELYDLKLRIAEDLMAMAEVFNWVLDVEEELE